VKKSPRSAALELLLDWQKTGTSVDILAEEIQAFDDPRDAGLFKAMVFGVLRKLALVDWVIGKVSSKPVKKLEPVVLEALRVGSYQLLFMDRIPASAAVNETVKALKKLKQPRWITGFVNGVLRGVERRKSELLENISAGKLPDQARLNHPEWLVKRWRKRYGNTVMEAVCQSNSRPAGLCLRVNRVTTSTAEFFEQLKQVKIQYRQGRFVPEAVWIETDNVRIENLPGFDEGFFSVQDEVAQLLCGLLAPFSPDKSYLDACAGLGGKAAVIAQLASDAEAARIVAVEPSGQRVGLLHENIARLRLAGVEVVQETLQDFARRTDEKFSAVLVDAPCSGLGVTGRHPDIRWVRSPEELKRYHSVQLELLLLAAKMVRPGGVLVYATCSTEPEENEQVVDQFLDANPGFAVEDARNVLAEECRDLVDERGCLRTLPGNLVSDGFFAVRLVCGSDYSRVQS